MHHVLQLPELVRHIIESLCHSAASNPEYNDGESWIHDQLTTSSLARLARTSKQFHEPAISKLWGTQFGIRNLIRCMPDDLWTIIETHIRASCVLLPLQFIEFKRTPRPSDWERFNYYAVHVRELVFPSPEAYWHLQLLLVSPAVHTALARYSGRNRPYLPHLRSLSFSAKTEPSELSDICMSFLGPSVSSLTVTPGCNDSASSLVALTQAPHLAPALQRLSIDFRWTPDPSCLLAGTLNVLRELRVLRIALPSEPSIALWAAIAALPSLVELGIEGCAPEEPANARLTPTDEHDNTFELAHVIHLSLLSLSAQGDGAGFLRLFDLPELTSLTMTFHPADIDIGEELLRAIADRCPSSLSELSIQPSEGVLDARITRCPARHLRILHTLHGLRKLHISPVCGLDDEILIESARAWPALEELSLTSQWRPGNAVTHDPTLLGLIYVAESCGRLRSLALDVEASLDAAATQWPHDAPPPGSRPNTKVTGLDVGISAVSDVAAVAAVLVRSFRSLSTILQHGQPPMGPWREVQDLLPSLYAEQEGRRSD